MVRLKIVMQPQFQEIRLSFAYQHSLTRLVYECLRLADSLYGSKIHSSPGRRLFCFSWLQGDSIRRSAQGLMVTGPVHFFIHSADQLFMDIFTAGLERKSLTTPLVEIDGHAFVLNEPIFMPGPVITDSNNRFNCLSPIFLTDRQVESSDAPASPKTLSHMRYAENPERFSQGMRENLIRKFRQVYGQDPADSRLDFRFLPKDMSSRKNTKLVEYCGNFFFSHMAPFEVSGSPELIRVGYECGFGEKTGMGFGSSEKVN